MEPDSSNVTYVVVASKSYFSHRIAFLFLKALSISKQSTMKLSFKAFIIATLMQSANANYDCSLCVAERAARPTTVKQAIEHLNIARMKQLFPLYYSGVLNGGDKELPYMQCWDTTGIEDFAEAFSDFKTSGNSLNGVDLNCWDTSSATTMTSMFAGTSFNGSLNSWDTSKVTDMAKMFYNMPTFNRSLNHFNTAKVTSMNSMFKTEKWVTMNPPFNQDLSTWDVSSVTDFHLMFRDMINFNSDLSRWDVSSAEKMTYMFYGAEKFNGDITSWDVSKVTSMGHMFQNAKMFNQNLSGWNVSNIKAGTGGVDGFGEMFMGALAFNQCMYAWDAIVAGELPLNMEFYRMFWGTSCPAVDGRSDDWGWANRGQPGTWCKDTECSPIPPPPAPVLPFGRFEVRHREVGESKEVGKLLAMEPRLDTELFFEVGPSITDTSNLGLEVYGTTGLVDDATMACADGKLITGDVLSTKAFTLEQASGTAGFTLDLTKLEETLLAYSGDKVDICARIKYDNTIQTFVDTRIVIDRTYTADLGETVTIGDPSSGKFNKADDTTVSVTEFFCDAEKTDIGTNLEFRAGQGKCYLRLYAVFIMPRNRICFAHHKLLLFFFFETTQIFASVSTLFKTRTAFSSTKWKRLTT